MKCLYCSEEIGRAGTKPKKYCSNSCKMKDYRRRNVTEKKRNESTSVTNLPLDVLRTINRISDSEEEVRIRSERAQSYLKLFPERCYNTGVALSSHKYRDKVYAPQVGQFNKGDTFEAKNN